MVGSDVRAASALCSVALACCAWLLGGCAGAPPQPLDPEVVARQEGRLLEPFQPERTVVADRLELVLTGNFYDELTLPVLLPTLQEEERTTREGGGTEIVYRNRSPQAELQIAIGGTRMLVLREVRLVVLGGRSAYRLEATLEGGVTAETVAVVEAGVREDCRQVRIADGVLRRIP